MLAAAGLLAPAGGGAQTRIFQGTGDFAQPEGEATAVKESVAGRSRGDYAAQGLTLGSLFDIPGLLLYGEPRIRDIDYSQPTAGDGLLPLLPLETAGKETTLSREDEAGLVSTAERLHGSLVSTYVVKPAVTVSQSYDDNIFRDDGDAITTFDDFITVVRPQLQGRSNFTQHQLNFDAGATIALYDEFSSENYVDYNLRPSVLLDIDDVTQLGAAFTYGRGHRTRGEAFPFQEGPEPTLFTFLNGDVDWNYRPDAFSAQFRYRYSYRNFRDIAGIDNDLDDLTTRNAFLRLGYELSPGTTAWVEPAWLETDYRLDTAPDGTNRDATAAQALAGFTYNASAVTYLEVGIGYIFGDVADDRVADYSGLAGEARLVWNVTDLVTLEASTGRHVFPTSFFSVRPSDGAVFFGSAATRTFFAVGAAWDPAENLIFEARYTGRIDDQQVPADFPGFVRRGHDASLSIRYLLNPYANVGFDYARQQQDSDQAGDSFTANVFTFRLTAQL